MERRRTTKAMETGSGLFSLREEMGSFEGRSALYLIEVPVYLVPLIDQAGSWGRVLGRINHADSNPRDIAWLRMALANFQEYLGC
jgi:hypothetical protein